MSLKSSVLGAVGLLRVVAAILPLVVWGPVRADVTILPLLPTDPQLAAIYDGLSQAAAAAGVPDNIDIRVTIGPQALRDALIEDPDAPLIATFVSSTEFAEALGARARPSTITAVYSNPDPVYQLELARAMLGNASVGVVDSPASHNLVLRLTEQSGGAVSVLSAGAGQVEAAIVRGTAPLDVLLVLPDTDVINRSNVAYIVRSLYQRQKVVIGYSDSLTRVGSLASVFPTFNGVANSTRIVLEAFVSAGEMPEPVFVSDIEITVNARLARSLNIAVPDVDVLVQSVAAAAGEVAQ